MTLLSYPIPNLINGVSQQAPSQRRDTQAEVNINIFNSPVDGAVARPPSELTKFHPGVDMSNGYYFYLNRGDTEKHIVVIRNGVLRIWDLISGNEATVTTPNGTSYLSLPVGADPADSFAHVAVEDTTFITNRTITPVMNTASKSPARPKEAVAFFRAGNYRETYQITLVHAGVTRVYSFKTVNNATAGNEEFIRTNFLAAAMETLIEGGTPANVTVVSNGGGIDIRTLGYTVTRLGSSVIIRHPTLDFDIKTEDGTADSAFRVIKEQVQKFSDLPTNCESGIIFRVVGSDAAREDDYWVTFKTGSVGSSSGVWEETVAPDTVLGLDDNTMPWTLVSLGFNSFRFERQVWAKRVAGDGILSSKNPEFVGRRIQDIFWWRGRLGILTEGSFSLSAARQPYTYFPSTSQTRLADDPISYRVAHTKVAVMRHAVVFNNQLLFWADGVQFVVNTGDILEEATIEVAAASEYDHNPKCRPAGAGSNVYFPSVNGDFSALWEYFVTNQGISKSADDVTAQAPSYIPGDVIRISGSTSLKMLTILPASLRNRLYIYNFFIAGEEKLQSSVSYWQFDGDTTILTMEFDNNTLFLLVQRPDGLSLESINCQPVRKDLGMTFAVRLDRRISETGGITGMSYNSGTDQTTFTVPAVTPGSAMKIVARAGASVPVGTEFPVVSINNSTRQVVAEGNLVGEKFYLGFQIPEAVYTFSEFFPKDGNNVFTATERVQLRYITIVHSNTGYYKVKVRLAGGKEYVSEFTGRILGDPENATDTVSLDSGEFRRPVKANARKVTITLTNDSWLPSAWQSAEYQYSVTARARKVK